MATFRSRYLFSLCLLPLLAGCNSGSDDIETVTVTVGSVPPLCSPPDEFRTLCPPDFADSTGNRIGTIRQIINFDYEFGTQYELLLEVVRLSDPPADGLAVEYHILEILSEEQDPVGTTYIYDAVPLVEDAFVVVREDVYALPPHEVLCADDTDCNALAEIANSGGEAYIELTMTGGSIPITLTYWN